MVAVAPASGELLISVLSVIMNCVRVGLPVFIVLIGERGGPLRALLLDFHQDALDPVVRFDAFVVEELQFGRTSEAKSSGELPPRKEEARSSARADSRRAF